MSPMMPKTTKVQFESKISVLNGESYMPHFMGKTFEKMEKWQFFIEKCENNPEMKLQIQLKDFVRRYHNSDSISAQKLRIRAYTWRFT